MGDLVPFPYFASFMDLFKKEGGSYLRGQILLGTEKGWSWNRTPGSFSSSKKTHDRDPGTNLQDDPNEPLCKK